MTKPPAVGCFECRHFSLAFNVEPTCAAFPDGIPGAVFFGEAEHLEPLPGDNGLQWEPVDGAFAPPALRLIQGSGDGQPGEAR